MFCEEEQQAYIYQDDGKLEGKWWPVDKSVVNADGGLQVSLFTLNAQLMASMPDYTDEDFIAATELIEKFHARELNRHYMLLCKEQSYFTILELNTDFPNEFNSLSGAVLVLCNELGNIKNIYENTAGDIDIWLQKDEDMWCLHLFAYDMGVVTFG